MRLVLHIGAPKTGTTDLQKFFSINASKYKSKGLLYPEAGRRFGGRLSNRHIGFRFAMKGPDGRVNGNMAQHGLNHLEARKDYVEQFKNEFDAEIAKSNAQTVLMSDEALFIFSEPNVVEQARTFLKSRFESVEILCFIRNPVEYIRGRYSQGAKIGTFRDFDAGGEMFLGEGLYYSQLRVWADVFGASNIDLRVSQPDTVQAVLKTVGAQSAPSRSSERKNTSLTSVGFRWLVEVNNRYAGRSRPELIRKAFEEKLSGEPFVLPKAIQDNIWRVFDAERGKILSEFIRDDEDKRIISQEWGPSDVHSDIEEKLTDIEAKACDIFEFMGNAHEHQIDALQAKLDDELRTAAARERKLQKQIEHLENVVSKLKGEPSSRTGAVRSPQFSSLKRFFRRSG